MTMRRRFARRIERSQKLLSNFVYYMRRGYSPCVAWNMAERTL